MSGRKLLFVYSEAGWVTRGLRMRPPWAPPEWSDFEYYDPATYLTPDDLEWEFDLADPRLEEEHFSPILRPLFRHRDVMTVTEGLSMLTSALDSFGDAHAQAHLHSWTAFPAVESVDGMASRGGAPSVDQRINEFIQQTNPDHLSMDFRCSLNPLPLHELLYRSDGAGGAARLPTETNPQAAYDRFFGRGEEGDPLTVNARASLSVALRQFDDLAPRLLGPDRQKLEAHRELLGSLERQFGSVVSCDSVTRPPGTDGATRVEKREADIQAFTNVIAAGFACGVSRVASLGSIVAHPESYGLPESTAIHHEYEHLISPELYYMEEGQTEEWLSREDAMIRRNVYQSESLARIIDTLRAVPDGEGSLLDSTLVVYMSELAHGGHGHEHFPTLMFGSGGGIVTPGRYIKYAQNNPIPYPRNYYNEFTGAPHSRLLVSILQGFGLDIDYLGAPSIEGFAAHPNVRQMIDLSGPLPRLRV
jgi:hypothetical protein